MKDARKQQPRVELDPPMTGRSPAEADAPPEKAAQKRADDPDIAAEICSLISKVGGEPDSFDGRLIRDMMVTALKLIPDERDTGELKLMTASLKELRYAYRVFSQYPGAVQDLDLWVGAHAAGASRLPGGGRVLQAHGARGLDGDHGRRRRDHEGGARGAGARGLVWRGRSGFHSRPRPTTSSRAMRS